MDDSTGYGRILRDTAGKIIRIFEEKDASPDERNRPSIPPSSPHLR